MDRSLCWSCFKQLYLKSCITPKLTVQHTASFHVTRTPTLSEITFMEKLGEKLGFKRTEDWYRITSKDLLENQGASILKRYRNSPVRLVMEVFHNYPWMPWKFDTPNRFWHKPGMEAKYISYLGEKMGFQEKEDWYKISTKDFSDPGGIALLHRHKRCAVQVVIDVVGPLLNYKYLPWKFTRAPRAWWHSSENRLEYMKYLGDTLGYTNMEDWYKISKQSLYDNFGGSMLEMHNGSPKDAVMDTFKDHIWQRWKFESPQSNNSGLQLADFLDSLASKLKIKEMNGWYSLSAKSVIEHGGMGILQQYKTVPQMLAKAFPEHKWVPWFFKSFQGTWDSVETRREFVQYLADKLGKKKMAEWHSLTTRDFRNHGGRTLIELYEGSPQSLLTSLFPSHRWEPWKFNRTYFTPETLRDFLQHVGEKLNVQTMDDWLRVSYNQIQQFGPVWHIKKKGLIPSLQEAFPEKDWTALDAQRSSPGAIPFPAIQRLLKLQLERNLPTGTTIEENYTFSDLSFSESSEKLTVDVFIPSLRLALDFQGEQHYDSNEFFGDTIVRQSSDAEKRQILEHRGYTFVQVDSWWDRNFPSLASIIQKQRPDIVFVNKT